MTSIDETGAEPGAPDSDRGSERRTAVVTGAGRGIGAAIAVALSQIGLDVAVVDIDGDNARAIAETIAGAGTARASGFACDVSDPNSVKTLMSEVAETIGAPSVLVNDAAIGRYAPIEELTYDDWRRMLGVNLIGPFLCVQGMLPYVTEAGGAVVNITSVGAHIGTPTGSAYAASKGGLISFTRTAAVELAPRRIRVNAVSPGPIDTPMTAQLSDAETTKRRLSRVPMARMGAAEEIASVVAFLVSDAASFMTGQIVCVDGGWTAQAL
jgi:NAD(P)-dependent dehydrogenase (short-subunit alcohol dehydrogenase family)